MKLVVVSNRLPVSVREESDQLVIRESPGGLASGLRSYFCSPKVQDLHYLWVGWPGSPVSSARQSEVSQHCQQELNAVPVFLSTEEVEAFYEGYCNNTLWPLFHYFTTLVSYDRDHWEAYERVNRHFCDTVLSVVNKDDMVWIHDYQLLLLPGMLRQAIPQLRIGFFLHIPFPSFEVFRLLPAGWRKSLLEGMLGADLIGFHTHDYTQHFLKCVRRFLGFDNEMGLILQPDRVTHADTFPMGIEFDRFSESAESEEVAVAREEFRRPLGDCRLILSIDRLDYTKGITNRLLAFQSFLEENPSWHGKVVLLIVVVPSRTGVEDYQRMKVRTDELVGSINGRFGTLTWTPIIYQYRSFPQDQLVPLYAASDVMLVTPMRDGMNLVAKEYVASRNDNTGVLVLSEMAGAATELGEALIVNPNDITSIGQAIRIALEMPIEVQQERMKVLRSRLHRYDVIRWAGDFLGMMREDHSRLKHHILTNQARQQLIQSFRSASSRLLLCDCDGTLVAIRPSPDEVQPEESLLATLKQLATSCDLAVVSGRPRSALEGWFGHLPVTLIAEHGVWIRYPGGEWTRNTTPTSEWKTQVRQLMEIYVDRLPGAHTEEKESTLAWHYRRAEPELAWLRSRELADHLRSLTDSSDLKVVEGNKVIEVKPSSTTKGVAVGPLLDRKHDFVLAMGDDTTDEDMFRALPEGSYSIRVGIARSYARYNVYNYKQILGLLDAFADTL